MWLHLLGHTCHLLYNLNAIHNRQNHPKDRFKHSQPQSYKPTSELVNPYHLKAWCRDWKSCKTVLRQQERSWNICNVLSHWSSSYVLYPRPTSPWKHRGLHVNDKSGVWLWDIKDGCGHYICLRYIYIYVVGLQILKQARSESCASGTIFWRVMQARDTWASPRSAKSDRLVSLTLNCLNLHAQQSSADEANLAKSCSVRLGT